MTRNHTRRRFLATTGAAAVGLSIAGCLGDDDENQPVASDDVLYWWPFDEGEGDAMEARIDDTGDADGEVNNDGEINWVEGDYVGGYAVESPEGRENYILTSTYGDFGSTMNEDYSLCVTFDLETDGVLWGSRSFDSFNGATIQLDGRADGRTGHFLRSDGVTSGENHYVWGETEVIGEGRFRAVITKGGNDAEDITVYLNGEEDNTIVEDNEVNPDNFVDLTDPFTFFAYNNQGDPQRSPDGIMDDFIIYDKALSEDEVAEDFDRQPWA